MFVRVLLIFTATLLLVTALSSVFSPGQVTTGHGAAAVAAAAANPTPPPRPEDVREHTLRAPSKKPLVVRVGDIVNVQATAQTDDVAEFVDLGMDATVSPGIPASFQVIADRTGRFPLTLRYSGEKIAELEVKPAS